jgi:arsenate reductase-like glutaredoxin family protein
MNKVKMGVAKYLTRPGNLGEGVELTSPYIPSEDLFQAEKDKHAARLSEISKTPKVDKLLMNIQEAEESIATPEAITDSLTKVASITAKGYGILNTFPGTELGDTNLKFMQTNIIVANAKAQFPNDATERSKFIEKKLYDNNIDPMKAIQFQNPVTYDQMTKVLTTQGNRLANSIAEKTNAMAQATTDEERVQIQNSINQLIMQQYALINTYSQSVPMAMAGRDKDKVGMVQPPETKTETETDTKEPRVEPKATPQELEKDLMELEEGESISPLQARFKFNDIDQRYLVDQWKKNYQSKNKTIEGLSANIRLLLGTNDMPQEAADQINQVANAFDGDRGFNRNQIAEMLSAIGFIESKYETKVQREGGPARSYWQVEPKTAADMLKQNLSAMKTGRSPLMGQNFENLFKSKYSEAIGNRTALEYFASLNEKQLQQLLLEDGLFAAAMAAHKVVSTFDPYGSREA